MKKYKLIIAKATTSDCHLTWSSSVDSEKSCLAAVKDSKAANELWKDLRKDSEMQFCSAQLTICTVCTVTHCTCTSWISAT